MSLQFLNSMYKRAVKVYDTDTRKKRTTVNDVLIYTMKDTETGETHLKFFEKPFIDFYISTKQQPFHKIAIPKSEARQVRVAFADRDKEIASNLGLLNEYFESWKNNSNWLFNKSVMKHPNLYAADTNLEDYFKFQCILKNGEVFGRYKKGFADIEVDISTYQEDFPDPSVAPCPIYLISYIDRSSKSVYCFILYDPRVAADIEDVATNPDAFLKEYCDKRILDENFKFYFNVYKTELNLIKGFFKVIHDCKPDFVGWWNMPFDMPTILNRLKRNSLSDEEIADIICHPEVPQAFRYVKYIPDPKREEFNIKSKKSVDDDDDDDDEEDEEKKPDTRSKNAKNRPHPSRLFDWIEAPGYTQFYDQLSMFSCSRKRELLSSYKLDDIGQDFGGIGKLDLEALGYSIKDVNVKNFKVCLAYNIRDSYVQYAIEEKQEDIDKYVVACSNTRISKGFSMSIVIKNEVMKYLWEKDQIMGNAIDYDIFCEFEGAIVGRPELIEQLGVKILGLPSYLFEDSIDLDASSLYPSLIITFNIFKSAIFGHITDVMLPSGVSIGNGDGLFEDLQTIDQSIFDIAESYFGLPPPESIISMIEKLATDKAEEKARAISQS